MKSTIRNAKPSSAMNALEIRDRKEQAEKWRQEAIEACKALGIVPVSIGSIHIK